MPHPGRNNIYDAIIKRMVNEALEAQEQEFAQNRGGDSDEQLLAYLQFCAELLGHTPWSREIVGGSLMENRFGSWEKALAKAKLPKPTTQNKLTGFTRYIEENERQKVVYRQKKAAKSKKTSSDRKSKKKNNPCDPPHTDRTEKPPDCPLGGFSKVIPPLSPWGRYYQKKIAALRR